MGSGTYCDPEIKTSFMAQTTSLRAADPVRAKYATASAAEIFTNRSINNAMSPHGIKFRESRDSKEHPESLAIILALDVTGSMGSVPHFLIKEGLPDFMERIIKQGIADPQVLFMGIGDHECDQAPLQVAQFESSDELLDKWLTTIWLEGGGGGNAGESYSLAWYFGAQHTAIDCWEKRKQKGFLFTIGDEPVLPDVPSRFLKHMMGDGQYEDYPTAKLLAKASETYHVFHVNICETASGGRRAVKDGWTEILRDNLLMAERKEFVGKIISDAILKYHGTDEGADYVKDQAETGGVSEEEVIL